MIIRRFLLILLSFSGVHTLKGRIQYTNNNNRLFYTENLGQVTDEYGKSRQDIICGAYANGTPFHIMKNGFSYHFYKVLKENNYFELNRLELKWIDSRNEPLIEKINRSNGYSNYYGYSEKEINNVSSFEKVKLKNIYEGIDVLFYSDKNNLKYDYIVHPGYNPSAIKINVIGSRNLLVNDLGELVIETELGKVIEPRPFAYQGKNNIYASWQVKSNNIELIVGPYDHTQPLIIDPSVRIWGTYYGDFPGSTFAFDCKTDLSGNVIMTGTTSTAGSTMHATVGALQTTYGGGNTDAFIAKFDSVGNRVWATYYGGTGDDHLSSCSVDSQENIYVAGYTSTNLSSLMTTPGSHQPNYGGGTTDGLIIKFNKNGIRIWASYYGGEQGDGLTSCDIGRSGYLYLIGSSASTAGIATPGTHNDQGPGSGIAIKFNLNGVRIWGTYHYAVGSDCAADANGNLFICGNSHTNYSNISTAGAHQVTHGGGGSDGFLLKFSNTGQKLWGTYYGGISDDYANSCAVDLMGNCYMHGQTMSPDNMATPVAHQSTFTGGLSFDTYLVKFNNNGVREWGTYYGTTAIEYPKTCCNDIYGNVFISGYTYGNGVNMYTPNAFQPFNAGSGDVYISAFNPAGVRIWATFYGGDGNDQAYGISADSKGNVFVCGRSSSTSTVMSGNNAFQTNRLGVFDGFVARIYSCIIPSSPVNITPASNQTTCAGNSATLTALGGGILKWYNVANGGLPISTGSVFVTPLLTNDATYFVEDSSCSVSLTRSSITASVFVCTSLETNYETPAQIILYPNPASEVISIKSINTKVRGIIVSDITGKILKEKTLAEENEIDISDLPNGLYLFKVATDNIYEKTFKISIHR